MAANKGNTRAWAVAVFVCALIAAFMCSQAFATGTAGLIALFLIEFIACLLGLVYLRREDLREHTWCEARR